MFDALSSTKPDVSQDMLPCTVMRHGTAIAPPPQRVAKSADNCIMICFDHPFTPVFLHFETLRQLILYVPSFHRHHFSIKGLSESWLPCWLARPCKFTD